MSLTLYFHPLSSYCQKVLVALYENDTPFERQIVDLKNILAPGRRDRHGVLTCLRGLAQRGEPIVIASEQLAVDGQP